MGSKVECCMEFNLHVKSGCIKFYCSKSSMEPCVDPFHLLISSLPSCFTFLYLILPEDRISFSTETWHVMGSDFTRKRGPLLWYFNSI